MYNAIQNTCTETYGLNQTTNALGFFCTWFSRYFTHYISARSMVHKNLSSVQTIEEFGDSVIHMYSRNSGKWVEDGVKEAPPFNCVDEAYFLETQPKWEVEKGVGAMRNLYRY